MSALRAVVFDLYGTLIRRRKRAFERQLPRRLGVDRRAWADLVRRELLVTAFASREAFVDAVLTELSPRRPPPAELRGRALELLAAELEAARPAVGAGALLRFLKRRGLKLGLISNLASPYREPLQCLAADELFDAVALSCDERRTKPDPELYLGVCERLGVAPAEALMVGDSLANDVAAPRRLGMQSLHVGRRWDHGRIPVAGVGWLELDGGRDWLLRPGREISLDGEAVRLLDLEPVPDAEQGRYNLVMSGRVERAGGRIERFFFKRFLLPESAHVEAFAHRLLAEVGIVTCRAGVLDGREPVFWSVEAPGSKVDALPPTPELAFEIGRHCASAFLFANADLRPRNAFLMPGEPRLLMVDHEHCLFNLALDLEGVAEPLNPRALDALGREEIERRVRKKVLSPLAMRRARRTFLDTRRATPEQMAAFRRGWTELHHRARRRRGRIAELVGERLHREPFLVIGTHGYRRAMARIDLDDLLSRIDLEPAAAVEGCL